MFISIKSVPTEYGDCFLFSLNHIIYVSLFLPFPLNILRLRLLRIPPNKPIEIQIANQKNRL